MNNEQLIMNNELVFVNPATGEQFGSVVVASEMDVRIARADMGAAAQTWRKKSVKERVRILRRLQAVIIDAVDEITAVINQDTGKSRQDGIIEVTMTVDRLHQYYKNAGKWLKRKRVPPGLYIFKSYYAEPHPFGAVAVLGPWNYPFDLTMTPVCSALLAGNTVLLKPSEVTSAVGVLIEELIGRVPELRPFVRVLHGDGRVGEALVASKPDLIFLTGSTATGLKIAQEAAKTLTPFLYELGGKDPMLVLEKADIAAAAKWGTWGAFYNTGQTCMGIERVYVEDAVYKPFVRAAIAEAKMLKQGYSAERSNKLNMGPLTFERQLTIVQEHLDDAVAKGARIVLGGKHDGLFMEPTIIVDVDHSMKLMYEETFGPLMPIMRVRDEAEALRLANDSEFGLSACVWSDDMRQAKRVAHRLDVGSVNINDTVAHYPVSLLPFGGVKKSGNARTHGKDEVIQFTQLRSYAVGKPPFSFDIATQMREPGRYRLGKAIVQTVFGVTTEQKVRPAREFAKENREAVRLGAMGIAGLTAVFLGWMLRKR